MKKAIIHLGYPKTGTTYLQEKIFPQAAEQWSIITPIFQNCNVNPKRFKSEVMSGEVSSDTRRKASIKPLLVSMEGFLFDAMRFVVGRQFCPTDFSVALRGLKSLCLDVQLSDIAFVICIRRQDQLIHSLYAESYTHQLRYVSELDTFDKYVSAVLSGDREPFGAGYYYSFGNALAAIRKCFPECEVHIRFYDDLVERPETEVEFWRELARFNFCYEKTRVNVRTKTSNVKVTDKSGLRSLAVRFKTRYFPGWKLPSSWSRALESVLKTLSFGSAKDIELSEERREEILRHFSAVNEELFVAEGIDVDEKRDWLFERARLHSKGSF